MKSRVGKALLWSSVGSVLVGTVVAAVARRPRRKTVVRLDGRRIPPDCRRSIVWTEPFEVPADGRRAHARDLYLLERTPFRAWSVLELGLPSEEAESDRGTPIYHVTVYRVMDRPGEDGGPREVRERMGRFYATAATVGPDGKPLGKSVLARGGTLALTLCNVGGTANGVETDEVHSSTRPILNFRFEYSNRPEEQDSFGDRLGDQSPLA